MITDSQCIFCKIVAGEIPSTKVFEDGEVLSFMDINPVGRGHLLVIPKNHYSTVFDIPEGDLNAVFKDGSKDRPGFERDSGDAGPQPDPVQRPGGQPGHRSLSSPPHPPLAGRRTLQKHGLGAQAGRHGRDQRARRADQAKALRDTELFYLRPSSQAETAFRMASRVRGGGS